MPNYLPDSTILQFQADFKKLLVLVNLNRTAKLEAEQKIEELEQQISVIKGENKRQKLLIERLTQERAYLFCESSDKTARYQKLEELCRFFHSQVHNQKTTILDFTTRLKEDKRSEERQRYQLENKLKSSIRHLELVSNRHEKSEALVDRQYQQLLERQDELHRSRNKIKSFEKQKSEKQEEISNLTSKLKKKEAEIQKLNSRIKSFQESNEDFQSQLKQCMCELRTLKRENASNARINIENSNSR
mmetsp:Transcript_22657/g.28910  ORF Transcript_22657/g.28910 Transcript_22657/m.28910 type:complete len:246 (-) Transcript_22657:383-1120(-)|eukprot:CAMPEP_0204873042 /NCGR_PEP_ID=MMETSP1348-20121228/39573_1 /ASSEMBLY_ACC=CAM_ASM_000700 /TAXON_ID=215587 /ORGANISM="Aplanochytrium stocchinoi, Strain GSBS06" /LENGTH=245 /DNA_ID=CAMNT_0052028175 /DNA_START=55 /DNA_END=792 /DNA_ORIENTATION=-